MHKVLNIDPPAPSEINVQVPRQFDALMAKALAKRPDERFQSARNSPTPCAPRPPVARLKRRRQSRSPAGTPRCSAIARLPGGGRARTRLRRRRQRAQLALVAGGVVALAAIVAGAFIALGPKEGTPPAPQPAPAPHNRRLRKQRPRPRNPWRKPAPSRSIPSARWTRSSRGATAITWCRWSRTSHESESAGTRFDSGSARRRGAMSTS
jgi:hypothetical protein